MLIAALRDLQWRRRRFLIAVIGTGVVFAMTLILTGLSHGFDVEAADTVDALGVDAWLVPEDATGPFLGAAPFPEEPARAEIAQLDGVTAAVPLVFAGTTMRTGDDAKQVNIYGAPSDGPGIPAVSTGRAPSAPDEAAVSSTTSKQPGDDIVLGSSTLEVVGTVGDSTSLAGGAERVPHDRRRAGGRLRRSAARVVDRCDG